VANSRDAILGALAATRGEPAPHAGFTGEPVRFADPVAAFRDALAAAGGALLRLTNRRALDRALAAIAPGAVVLAGGPAVAESGAVWWVPRDEVERRAAFLADRMILVVARAQLVDDLHAAYRQIDPAATHYGCFVAGPSKTADIEQALVIGAHGPRALDVYLWGAEPARADQPLITI
jgi:L-lactate dehydrogenase complex protein LldG